MKKNRKINIDDIEKKQVFSVPDGYFEDLPAAIQKRVSVQNKGRGSLYLYWIKYAVSFACIISIFLLGYLFYTSTTQQKKLTVLLSEVSNEDIINYLGQSDIAQSELIERAAIINVSLDEDLLQDIEITDDLLLYETTSLGSPDTI